MVHRRAKIHKIHKIHKNHKNIAIKKNIMIETNYRIYSIHIIDTYRTTYRIGVVQRIKNTEFKYFTEYIEFQKIII